MITSRGQGERDASAALPARQGHFLLESGYHTDVWLPLDALFVSPREMEPLVADLAARLRPHAAAAVCGPLVGGAFLAQAVATELRLDFYFTEPVDDANSRGLFGARYRLPPEVHRPARGKRVAVVDDVISAGSSVRATVEALGAAGASTAVVGTLLLLGTVGRDHFANAGIPVEALGRRDLSLWQPAACPLCAKSAPLEDPRRIAPRMPRP
jgi:orotate phosphoribosyltransferase